MQANFSMGKFSRLEYFSGTSFNNKIKRGVMVVMIAAGQGAMQWIRLLK
jgi:hypothetical protein